MNYMTTALWVALPLLVLGYPPSQDAPVTRTVIARTGSMEPTIPINSRLLVDSAWYATHPIGRFDIIAFERRASNSTSMSSATEQIVARIVGLPGEKVSMRGGVVYIDGRPLEEPFRTVPCGEEEFEFKPCGEMAEQVVPSGRYFLLADNRPESEDSRYWTPATVAREQIVGKVVQIVPTVPPAAQQCVPAEPAHS